MIGHFPTFGKIVAFRERFAQYGLQPPPAQQAPEKTAHYPAPRSGELSLPDDGCRFHPIVEGLAGALQFARSPPGGPRQEKVVPPFVERAKLPYWYSA